MESSDVGFDEYFTARAASLRRTAFLIVRDWQLAEDMVQSAFVKIYLAWPRIRTESRDAYTRRAVVNTSISHARRSWREVSSHSIPDRSVDDPDPGDLMEILGVLPPAQRAVIALRFLDDLSVADVADALRVSEGTVKTHSSRGLATLRARLPHLSVGRSDA